MSTSSTSSRTTTASSPHPGLPTTRPLAASALRSLTPTPRARSARSMASRWTLLEATSTSTRLGSPAWTAARHSTPARSRLLQRRSTCRSAAAQGSRSCMLLGRDAGHAVAPQRIALRRSGSLPLELHIYWPAQTATSDPSRHDFPLLEQGRTLLDYIPY